MWELCRDAAVSGKGGEEAGLGEHGVRVGDVVGVRGMEGKKGKDKGKGGQEGEVRGVVVKVSRDMVAVALDKEEEAGEGLAGETRVWMCVLELILVCAAVVVAHYGGILGREKCALGLMGAPWVWRFVGSSSRTRSRTNGEGRLPIRARHGVGFHANDSYLPV